MTRKRALEILTKDIDRAGVHIIAANDEETMKYNQESIEAWNLAIESLKAIDKITEWINTPNRGNSDYFIVDKIEEIINEVGK